MTVTKLKAENYRNIEAAEMHFDRGVNLLFGENAQGKTNALECIYSFARGKSFRATPEKELIRFGADYFHTELSFRNKEREQTLSHLFSEHEKVRMRNGVKITKLSEMIGHFRAVLFYPEHLMLIKGGPSERREFLNIAISQCYPVYLKLYAEFAKILENRNCLLKFAQKGLPYDQAELEIWTERLIERSADIYLMRKKYISMLSSYTEEIQKDISSGRESLQISYESEVMGDDKQALISAYRQAFSQSRAREIGAGCSLFGIHRDDLDVMINQKSARSFASQGQQRSSVLALKLAEGEVSREISGEYPVFLFDDVLSELDAGRRAYVLSHQGEKQFIITACEKSGFDPNSVNMIEVSSGTFEGRS